MSKQILIADDDPHIVDVVTFALEKAGMKTKSVFDGKAVLQAYDPTIHHLIILDINMPEKDGLDVCREIRKYADVPILFLSSRDEEIDRIIGLELGADDYITKPFSPRELVARVKVILKRAYPIETIQPQQEAEIIKGDLKIQPDKHLAFWNHQALHLTATEFLILYGMAKYPDHVFSRDKIMDIAYDPNIHVSDRTIDSHIRNLRQKFADKGCLNLIQTIHGVGYKLSL